jgi:uncharacterized DUF497 family protein
MPISYDENKRAETLEHRGLDFADAGETLFSDEGFLLTVHDDRREYGEQRWQTMGPFRGDIVMIVWTIRDGAHRIISMRKCNDREKGKYHATVDRSG